MSPQTPPTDRPLTAGDVPLLREGDLLRARNGKLLSYAYTDKKGWAFCDGFGPPIDRDAHTLESFTFVSRPATSAASEGEDKANHDCLAKRRPGEPMFILLGRDPDAHTIVQLWADRRLAAGGDPDHCRMGYDTAERMAAYAKDPANKPASAPDAVDYPALASPPVSERERELEGALAPFAAIARVMETRDRMALGKLRDDNDVVASVSWEGGLGVLVMGHLRDALTLVPNPKGWGGLYRRALTAQPQEPV